MRFLPLFSLILSLAAAAADPASDLARARFRQAQSAYDVGKLDEALRLYTQAYEAKPLPGFLHNIAQCHRQLGNFDRAAFYFRRYLDLSPRAPNAVAVRELIQEVEAKHADREKRRREEAEAQRKQELELARQAAANAEANAAASRQAAANREAELAAARALAARPTPRVEPEGPAILKKWWFWTGVGVLAAGGATTAWVLTAPQPRPASLGTDSLR